MDSRLSCFESCVPSFMMGNFDMQKRIFILTVICYRSIVLCQHFAIFRTENVNDCVLAGYGLQIIKYKCVKVMHKKLSELETFCN